MAWKLQEWIHRFEEGAGSKIVLQAVAILSMVALVVFYNMAAFRNLSAPEAMDAAQLARQIAEGDGYTTDFIRPLSLHLVYAQATNVLGIAESQSSTNQALSAQERLWLDRLQINHPDLANPPVYPVLLAAILKLNPFGWPDVAETENFSVYKPDLWITFFNQGLMLIAALLVFNLARRLFDEPVAWVSSIVFLGTDLFWEFSVSGLPTMLLVVLFLALVRLLLTLETETRSEMPRSAKMIFAAAGIGVLVALCALTRYSLAVLILPLGILLATLPSPKRLAMVSVAALTFLLLMTPWIARNYYLSGTPFGTAGYTIFQDTESFPADQIQRASQPDFREFSGREFRSKFVRNARRLLQSELLQPGGSWASSFFLVGLLVPFRNLGLRRLRTFLVLSLMAVSLAQALASTDSGAEVSAVHAQNSLAVLAPVVFIFGVSLFFTLLDQGMRSAPQRLTSIGVFCLVLAAPFLMRFLPPHSPPLSYPPYFPPWIQQKARHLGDTDWTMTDIPWALAWYGHRPGVWLSHYYIDPFGTKYVNDFFQIHQTVKPISALYLSAETLEQIASESMWNWVGRNTAEADWEPYVSDWESFALIGIYLNTEVPQGFPLKNAPRGIFPELFLTDSEHIAEKSIQSP